MRRKSLEKWQSVRFGRVKGNRVSCDSWDKKLSDSGVHIATYVLHTFLFCLVLFFFFRRFLNRGKFRFVVYERYCWNTKRSDFERDIFTMTINSVNRKSIKLYNTHRSCLFLAFFLRAITLDILLTRVIVYVAQNARERQYKMHYSVLVLHSYMLLFVQILAGFIIANGREIGRREPFK